MKSQIKHLRFNLTSSFTPSQFEARDSPDCDLIKPPESSTLKLAARLKAMCCFSVSDVFLDDPPPEKEKEKKEEKKEEKVKKNYVLVSDQLNLQPIVSEHHFFALHFSCVSFFLHFHPSLHNISQHLKSSTTTSYLPLKDR